MKTFGQVLLPLDGSALSEGIIPYVAQISSGLGSRVTIMYVASLEEAASDKPEVTRTPRGPDMPVKDYLAEVEQILAGHGVPAVDSVMASGVPSVEIARHAEEQGCDLIAMATHGRSGLGKWVFGSTTDKVMHSTALPMLLLRPQDAPAQEPDGQLIRTTIVPLDGSALAEAVLPVVEVVATGLGLKVVLVRVALISSMVYAGFEPYGYSYDPKFDETMDRAADEYLQDKTSELQQKHIQADSQRLRGNPATQIIDFAEKTGAAMVIMSTHGRTGVGRWILGSVADRVLRSSHNPILLLRPEEASEQSDQ